MPPSDRTRDNQIGFRHVSKRRDGGADALRDFSLEVAAGEFVALLGPADAGGPAALGLLAGFQRPDAGEVWLAGRSVGPVPARRRGVGYVGSLPALLPHMTVAENAGYPLRLRGVRGAARAEQVRPVLAALGLEGLEQRRPGRLTQAERMRTALARAFLCEAGVMVLDAPFGGLEPRARAALWDDLRRLHARRGGTVLLATEDAAEALSMSDRVALLDAGAVRQFGTPEELYERPADGLVARSVGETNRLPGFIEAMEDDVARVRLACGAVVGALLADARPGDRCVVGVRPERVALAAVPADEMGEGAVPAELLETVYGGDHVRLRLRIGFPGAAPADVVVKRPAGVPLRGLAPGAPASVAWQPHHARAYVPEPGA